MDFTPRHGFSLIASQQASKHTAINASLQAIDVLVQAVAKSRALTAPPGSPAEGDSYIVAASATGAWAGKDGRFATWADAHWVFRTAATGWLIYVEATDEVVVRRAGGWEPFATNGGTSVARFGINTSADLSNRLASAADATLLTHDGDDHRLVINKAGAGDTASIVYQAGYSGRAELGLSGDNHWRLKISPDGSSWTDALVVDNASGGVTAGVGVTTPTHRLDGTGVFDLVSGVVRVGFDTGDQVSFDRAANVLTLAIGGSNRFTWSAAGFRPAADNSIGLGGTGLRFTSVWAATGTIQTSDETQKTDIATSDLGLDFIRALNPVSYRWIVGGNDEVDGVIEARPGRRRHYGLVAQQVRAVLDAQGAGDFGGYVRADPDDPASEAGLRYDQFIAPIVAALQELAGRLEQAEARLAAPPAGP